MCEINISLGYEYKIVSEFGDSNMLENEVILQTTLIEVYLHGMADFDVHRAKKTETLDIKNS